MRAFALFSGLSMVLVLLPFVTSSGAEIMGSSATRSGLLHGSAGHHAAGSVQLTVDSLILTLEEITPVPDGRIYLAPGSDHRRGVELGRLNRSSGVLRYPLPPGLDVTNFDSVVIWCEAFSVEIGRATLSDAVPKREERTMHREESRSATFAVQ